MPAKSALIKDGWTITHDPLSLKWGLKDLFVDLGAQRLLAAEKGREKIAVEVKSFVGPSDLDDLEKALGQYVLYHDVLSEARAGSGPVPGDPGPDHEGRLSRSRSASCLLKKKPTSTSSSFQPERRKS